jgi:glyoxylase-like metal-dependent hydrolase (beta-lactamase superfamily II)
LIGFFGGVAWGGCGSKKYSVQPVPPERLHVIDEGDRISLGRGRHIDVLYTPGHAKHHVVFLEAQTGGAFIGDAVGLAFPHGHMVQPVTPPPDFDPQQVTTQLRRLADRDPGFLGFAHFGPEHEPLRTLAEAESRLWGWVRWVEEAARSGPQHLADALRTWVLEEYRAQGHGPEVVDQYDRNTFWPMQVTGILHWMARRGAVG